MSSVRKKSLLSPYFPLHCDTCQRTVVEPITTSKGHLHSSRCKGASILHCIIPVSCLETTDQQSSESKHDNFRLQPRISDVLGTIPAIERLFPEAEYQRCGKCGGWYSRMTILDHIMHCTDLSQSNEKQEAPQIEPEYALVTKDASAIAFRLEFDVFLCLIFTIIPIRILVLLPGISLQCHLLS